MSDKIVTDVSAWCENGHLPKIMQPVSREVELKSDLYECPECQLRREITVEVEKTMGETYTINEVSEANNE